VISLNRPLHRWAEGVCFLLFLSAWCAAQPTSRSILCRNGSGTFDAQFRTGVSVHIGAARGWGRTLATRACAATLTWEKQELIVANGVAELDLDAFGIDFGDGVPAAAFQIKKSVGDCCAQYGIYSLEKPPRLLRTITDGEFFNASDADLDGRVEIWTNDAAAVNGFEGLTLSELDLAPTAVLRLVHGHLEDVSSEFSSHFDEKIAPLKEAIHSQDLKEFKNSDGRLTEAITPASAEGLHRLRATKVKVLEIIWAFLYSGREQEAWRSLAEMWVAGDLDRIRAATLKTRSQGIHSQADAASAPLHQPKKKKAQIFDAVSRGAERKLEVVPPQPILLEFPPASGNQSPNTSENLLDLIVDAAGKVESAQPQGTANSITSAQLAAASTWKFVPAFKDGRPVASRLRISVSPKQ